jgi:hypothetical protein
LDFIPINSIDDVDPEKISIRDINKRYIDREGNRYATRFNLQTRKVEVVRIVKTRLEAHRLSQQIKREKTEMRRAHVRPGGGASPDAEALDRPGEGPSTGGGEFEAPAAAAESVAAPGSPTGQRQSEIPEYDDLEGGEAIAPVGPIAPPGPDMHSGVFIEQQLIDEIIGHLPRCKEGQQVVINNLKNSHCFEGAAAAPLNDVVREVDVDCWQASENAINYQKELYGYPRSVSQYTIRLTPEERARVEALPDDSQRMEVIRRAESRRTFEEVYRKIDALTRQMLGLIDSVSEEQRLTLLAVPRQQLEDARASTEILLDEVQEKLQQIGHWKRRYP